MNCIVCFEDTKNKTSCNHPLCNDCKEKIITKKCPYCRQDLEYSHEIIMAFFHFVHLFDSFYKENHYYQQLKQGIDLKSIITTEILFYIKEIDDFNDKGIRLKIYKQSYQSNYSVGSIVFSTMGLEEEKKEYRYFTFNKKGIMLENYFNE